ncbi:MAG TPA: hypothetical protein VNB24_07545 [Acidimicrobiales bacterium]|nr:hypothetical protein [Acidimicrobiales bacterium]
MKRFILLGVAVTSALGVGTTPASADIHAASQCAGSAAITTDGPSDGSLTFGGIIKGPKITAETDDHLTIRSVTFTYVATGAKFEAGTATATFPATQVTVTKNVPGAVPGAYDALMRTSVNCGSWSGAPVRRGLFLFVPGADPVKLG